MPQLFVNSVLVSEDAGSAIVTLRLSSPADASMLVNWTTTPGTAVQYQAGDYTGGTGSVTFGVGESLKTITIPITNDLLVESNESFWVNLSLPAASPITLQNSRVLVSVLDNDASGASPVVSIGSVFVDEASGLATFAVTLDRASTGSVTVNYATSDLSAQAGSDYTASSGTLTFPAGSRVQTVSVPVARDAIAEGAEAFVVTLSSPSGATLAEAVGTAVLWQNGATPVLKPTVWAADAVATEGAPYVEFPVWLDAPSSNPVSISYNLVAASADSYQYGDYASNPGTLTFAAGQTFQMVRVALTNDAVAEKPESFWLTLGVASGSSATMGRSSALGTIIDNDQTAGTPVVTLVGGDVDERSGMAAFTVLLDGPSTGTVLVPWATVDGTAVGGADFTSRSGTVGFAPGETAKTVFVPLIDDATQERAEQFAVRLGTPTGATLAGDRAVITIGANDAAAVLKPTLFVDDAIVGEADGHADMVLRLDAPSSDVITITYATVEALAKSYQSADYVTTYGTLSFAPGQTVQTVRVPITNDAVTENPESFFFTTSVASGSSAVTLARDAALVNIVDNDPASLTGTPVATVTDVTVDEQSGGFARFTVTLDRPASAPVTVQYATVDGTALASADFLAASGTLVFAPGDTAQTVAVALVDDAVLEAAEQFRLQLSLPSGATLASDGAVATIGANDAPALARPTLSIEDVVVGEADGYAELVLRLNAPSAGVIAVNYSTSEALAKSYQFADFVTVSGTVNFAPGQTVQTVRVPIVDDAVNESVESFFFRTNLASGSSAVTLGRDSATVSIVDNDPAVLAGTPTVSVADAVVDETTGGFVRFTVTLDRPAGTAVSVHYQTADDTALAGQDYLSASGTLVFAPGDTAQTLLVAIPDDATRESVEQFQLRLDTPVGATLGQGVARATLDANDAPALLTPTLSVEDATVGEGDGYLDVLLRLDAPSAGVVAVNYSTVESQATGYSYGDYATMSGTVSFAPGQTLQTVRIPIVNDALTEDTESFFLRVNVASGSAAVSLARGAATLTIVDNDPAVLAGTPFVSVRDVVVDESAGYARFAVVLDRPAAAQASVAYTTADRTAVAGQDYLATSGTLVFAAGETAKTVRVPIVDDATQEYFEQFVLSLSDPAGLVLGDAQGRATIGFSDQAAVLSPKLSVSDMVAGEIDGTGRFTLWLDAPSASPITINYSSGSTSPTSAVSGTDFEAVSSTVTFAPGTTTATVSVPVDEDANIEGAETFRLNLSVGGGSSVSLARAQATGTIVDNDSSVVVGIPAVSIGSASLSEHDTLATFNVTLDRAAVGRVTVNYATVDGTALAGRDYRGASGVVTFLPGETAKTVQVSVIDDSARENDEQFSIVVSAPVGMTIAGPTGTGTILNDDANGAPTAADASLSTPEDIPLSGALPAATDPEGDPVTYARVSGPAHGTLAVLADGTYTYTPAANYSGADAFSYSVTDNLSASSTYNVSLGVTAVNDAPTVAIPIPDQSASAGSVTTFAFAANTFSDVDSATLTYAATLADGSALPAWVSFTPGTRTFRVEPQITDAVTLNLKVTASDGSLSASDTFALAVSSVPGIVLGGTAARDTLTGTAGNDTISGFGGNDLIAGLAGNDRIDGGDGLDTARYDVPRAQATIALGQTTSPYPATVSVPGLGTDTLANVERLRFSDLAVAFDVTPTGNVDDPITKGIGGNGGKTYRLYQAAFARTPDLGGLGYWIDQVDQGATLFNIASGFLGSPEFKSKYGANPTNQEYTRALYLNVLHREPDETGYAYWNALLDGKPYNGVDFGSTTRQQMLVDFSEGNENKANVIEIIGNGFDYQPWG